MRPCSQSPTMEHIALEVFGGDEQSQAKVSEFTLTPAQGRDVYCHRSTSKSNCFTRNLN